MTKLAKTLLIGAISLAFASPASAAPPETEVDSTAVLLAAHPEFHDPLWLQTVLLAAPLPHGGHVGLILNRPTGATLGNLFPEHAASQKIADSVYFGGPFSSETLVALVSAERSPGQGSFAIASGLFLAVNGQTIDRVIEQRPDAARYYVGVVLWRPGELQAELAKGLWSVHEVQSNVLRRSTEGLWRDLTAAARGLRAQTPVERAIEPG
jgi:putative transcriptional regulator